MAQVCLALGANIGDRLASLQAAIEAMTPLVRPVAVSRVYETDPMYATDQPLFLNAALRAETELDPQTLLLTLKDLERDIGRLPTFRYGPRLIDIDIVLYDDLALKTTELTIPHALMHERLFVLQPLADVANDWRHPTLDQTVGALLAKIAGSGGVRETSLTLTLPGGTPA
jgi:2-amino-4-hydroxy-6-hydroxymethyldihydropteridine diphosphokinase